MNYCTQQDIESLFGVENVARWSNLDNQSTAADTVRMSAAIAYASARIDDRFRNSRYTVPLTGTAGALVQIADLAARLAGCWLYESRGLADHPRNTPSARQEDSGGLAGHRQYVERMIGRYVAGQDQLAAVQARMVTTAPMVSG